jgi:hypothetical protein
VKAIGTLFVYTHGLRFRAKARVLHLAITREADGFDYLDNPEAVREHLFPDGLLVWSLAEDVLAAGDAA